MFKDTRIADRFSSIIGLVVALDSWLSFYFIFFSFEKFILKIKFFVCFILSLVCQKIYYYDNERNGYWFNFLTMCDRSPNSRNCTGSWARMLPPTHPAVKDIQQKEIHEVSGDVIPINMVKGIGHLRDPRLNKVF